MSLRPERDRSPSIRVRELACRRGGRPVFADLTFAVASGEALLVTGRNGAGKSSLLAILAGLIRPDHGLVEIGGPDARRGDVVHLAGHRDALKPALTAAENLRFAATLLGADGRDPRAALSAVGLERGADLPVAILSAGQRRRVALARLLVARRPVWLLDEPTAALDAGAQGVLAAIMRDHLASGGSIVAATHAPIALPDTRTLHLGELRPAAADPDPAFA